MFGFQRVSLFLGFLRYGLISRYGQPAAPGHVIIDNGLGHSCSSEKSVLDNTNTDVLLRGGRRLVFRMWLVVKGSKSSEAQQMNLHAARFHFPTRSPRVQNPEAHYYSAAASHLSCPSLFSPCAKDIMSTPSSPTQPSRPRSIDASPKHQYTSLSSLIHSSPSSSSKQDTYGNKPQRSGWHLPSVEEERTSRRNRSRSKSRNQADGPGKKEKEKGGSMSMWKMMALTVSMGGGQVGGEGATLSLY